MEAQEEPEDFFRRGGIEVARGLVQQPQGGPAHQGPGQAGAGGLAAGEQLSTDGIMRTPTAKEVSALASLPSGTGAPPTVMRPSSQWSSPATQFSRVVLPTPETPTMAQRLPASTSRSKPSNTPG